MVAICFVKKDTDKQVTWGTRCSHQRAAAPRQYLLGWAPFVVTEIPGSIAQVTAVRARGIWVITDPEPDSSGY